MLDIIYDIAIETSIKTQKRILELQEEFLDPDTSWDRRNKILEEQAYWLKYESEYLKNMNEALKH